MNSIHIFLLLSAFFLLLGLYKTFEKAGEKGWKAFVPVYNFLVWLKIIKKPWWWIFLILIPTVGFYMLAIMIVLLSNCFGKRNFISQVFAFAAYFIWIPYLGFSKDVKFTGVPAEEKNKHWLKDWGEAGLFAIIAATLIRTFSFEAFVIPSSSMEGTLLVGDYLFVSKMSYGAKIPAIPLTIPFTHNTLPISETAVSYLDWIELPYMRLPGFGSVERNDIVVFNFPEGDTVWKRNRNTTYYQVVRDDALQNNIPEAMVRQQMIDEDMLIVHPVDKEDNYVKRCVAIAGDKLEIKKHVLYINGKVAISPQNLQFGYFVKVSNLIAFEKARLKYSIEQEPAESTTAINQMGFDHLIQCSEANLKKIAPYCDSVFINEDAVGQFDQRLNVFPNHSFFKWNKDNFGPIVIPKKGMTVKLSIDSLPLWERVIRVYEGNTLETKGNQFIINGKPATTYTFKQDYYWLMGDNRHNSLDSRFWGYVPADHVVGKPVFVWMSKGAESGFRPERIMTFVSKEGLSKSYLWWVFSGIILITGFNYFRSRKLKRDIPVATKTKK